MNRKKTSSDQSFDARKLILEVHLTEFSRLRDELLFYQSQKSIAVNFSFLALAGLLSFIPDLLAKEGDYVLLTATLPFFGITWYAMSMENMISNLSHYLKTNLIPKVNSLLLAQEPSQFGIPKDALTALEWEHQITAGRVNNLLLTVSDGIFNSGRAIMLFGPILVFLGVFLFRTRIIIFKDWTSLESKLLLANIIGLILFAAMGLIVRGRYGK